MFVDLCTALLALLAAHGCTASCIYHQGFFHSNINVFFTSFTIYHSGTYHQGLFHYIRRNPSLYCIHRRQFLAIIGHAGPRWRIRLSLRLVLCLPCRLVHSRGVHSVTLFVHLFSLNRQCVPPIDIFPS